MRRAVGLADHHMSMNLGIALFQRDVAGERQYLDLLAHRDPAVLPALAVEVTEHHLAERADRREMRGTHSLAPGEAGQCGHQLVALVEHERPGLESVFVEHRRPHVFLLTAHLRTEGASGGPPPLSELVSSCRAGFFTLRSPVT